MTSVFLHFFNLSVIAGWMVLAVLLLRLCLKKAPRWVTCVLWGLVALRLVVPFTIESPVSLIPTAQMVVSTEDTDSSAPVVNSGMTAIDKPLNDWLQTPVKPQGTPPVQSPLPPVTDTTPDVPEGDTNVTPQPPVVDTPTAPEEKPVDTEVKTVSRIERILNIAAPVWLVGIGLMLAYELVSVLRVRRRVWDAVLLRDNVWQSDRVSSPFIFGLFRPRIYVPYDLEESMLEQVLSHERSHLHRRDHWIKPFAFTLLAVYWYNPLLWVAYILLCRDIEVACDERVVRGLDEDARRQYATALLQCGVERRSIAACPLAFGEVSIKQRIKSVLNYRKPLLWVIIASLLACSVAAVCLLTVPIKPDSSKGAVTVALHLETEYMPDELYYFNHNIVTVTMRDDFVMIDTLGNRIGKESYYFLYAFGDDGRAEAQLDRDSDWVWIDTAGAVVGPAEAPSANGSAEIYSSEETQDGKLLFGVKDTATGEPITQPIFEWINGLYAPMDYAMLAEGEHRQVMISPRGEVLVTLPDETRHAYATDTHIVCRYQDGTYRLLDSRGNLLNQTAFSSISDFSDGLAVVTIGNKMGLISADGTVVFEPQIDIDNPVNKCRPLICGEYIACLKQEKLIFYKITRSDNSNGSDQTNLPDYFLAVLQNKQAFVMDENHFNGEAIILSRLLEEYDDYIGQYTLVDMDEDDVPELVVQFRSFNFNLVIRKDGNNYYGYLFSIRAMHSIRTDGTFSWAEAAGYTGCSRLRFNGDTYQIVKLWHMDEYYSHGSYYIGGEEVTKEAYLAATVNQAPLVTWVEWKKSTESITPQAMAQYQSLLQNQYQNRTDAYYALHDVNGDGENEFLVWAGEDIIANLPQNDAALFATETIDWVSFQKEPIHLVDMTFDGFKDVAVCVDNVYGKIFAVLRWDTQLEQLVMMPTTLQNPSVDTEASVLRTSRSGDQIVSYSMWRYDEEQKDFVRTHSLYFEENEQSTGDDDNMKLVVRENGDEKILYVRGEPYALDKTDPQVAPYYVPGSLWDLDGLQWEAMQWDVQDRYGNYAGYAGLLKGEYGNREIEYAYHDLDADVHSELLVLEGLTLSVYTMKDNFTHLLVKQDFASGTSRFLTTGDSAYPGLIYFCVGGGKDRYYYLSLDKMENQQFVLTELWTDNYAYAEEGEDGRITELSDDKKLIALSREAYQNNCDLVFSQFGGSASDVALNQKHRQAVQAYFSDSKNHRDVDALQPETMDIIQIDGKYYQTYVSGKVDMRYIWLSQYEADIGIASWDWVPIGTEDDYSLSSIGKIDDGQKGEGMVRITYSTSKNAILQELQQSCDILEQRLTAMGMSGYRISITEDETILLEVPRSYYPGNLNKRAYIWGSQGELAICVGDTEDGIVPMPPEDTVLDYRHVSSAEAVMLQSGKYAVTLTFTAEGADLLADITTELAKTQDYLYIHMDWEFEDTLQVLQPITDGECMVTGFASWEAAALFAAKLNAGILPYNYAADVDFSFVE